MQSDLEDAAPAPAPHRVAVNLCLLPGSVTEKKGTGSEGHPEARVSFDFSGPCSICVNTRDIEIVPQMVHKVQLYTTRRAANLRGRLNDSSWRHTLLDKILRQLRVAWKVPVHLQRIPAPPEIHPAAHPHSRLRNVRGCIPSPIHVDDAACERAAIKPL